MATTSNNHPFGALVAIVLTVAVLAGAIYAIKRILQSQIAAPEAESLTDIDTIQDSRALGYSGQRKIATGPDGSVYVAYRKNFQNNSEIFVARVFAQNGQTVVTGTAKPIAVVAQQDDQRVPSIAVDSKGVIHVLWYGADEAGVKNNRQIKYARSSDLGQSWSGWRNITFVPGFTSAMEQWQEHPSLLIGRDDTFYAVWEGKDVSNKIQQIKFSSSTNGGDSWSAWKNISPQDGVAQSRPSLVEDPQGRLYLFMYSTGGNVGDIQNIYYATSSNKGATWSTWQTLSDGKFDARHVSVSADDSGNVHAAWRQPIIADGPSRIVLRTFSDGQWSRTTTVSPSVRFQFFPSLGVDASGNAYVAWLETDDASGFPREDPTTGASRISFMKNGVFQTPLSLGQSATDLYPNVPARLPAWSKLPVVFEEKSSENPDTFTVKLRSISPTQ
ncbi:MAG: sialidase family protein [Parcubacteria group bacterium]|jgi:hypothetical protein